MPARASSVRFSDRVEAKPHRLRPFPRAIEPSQALGLSERLFVALHRHTATNVTRVIELEGVIGTRELLAALRSLQARHPLRRAEIAGGSEPRFVFGGAEPIPLCLVRRQGDRHWRELLETLLNKPLRHAPGPLFEVHYLTAPRANRSELILVGEHAACDGISLNQLAAELLELCVRGMARAPRARPPVLDQLLPPASAFRRTRGFGRALGKFARVAVSRMRHERRHAGQTSAHAFGMLGRHETTALMQAAKKANTTVTGALMAAVMQAVRETRPDTPRLAMSVPVNLRPRFPGVTLTAEDLGNYTGAVYLESEGRASLWPLARDLKAQLDAQAQNEDLLAAVPLVYKAGSLLVRADKPPLAHAMVSNSGVVPLKPDYGSFKVTGFFSATSAPMVSADHCFFCNTLNGQLCINLVFAREVVSPEEAERVLAHVLHILTYETAP